MKKGEVWFVDIPQGSGHEQTGLRPVVVLSDVEADIVIVVPFTSNLQALRFPHTVEAKPSAKNGLKATSVALVFQLRAIDKRRLIEKIGELEEDALRDVERIIKAILQL